MDPIVSVITRTFNRSGILRRAVRSITTQTLRELELIIVDDASTDDTADVIEAMRQEDQRIIYVRRRRNSREMKVREEPMNDGIAVARGRYVAHLDDDNSWHPAYLRRLVQVLENEARLAIAYADTCNHLATSGLARLLQRESRVFSFAGRTAYVIPHLREFRRIEFATDRESYLDYVDTNEMVVRRAAMDAIGGRWIAHPDAAEINEVQGSVYGYRNHADMHVAERVAGTLGNDSLRYEPTVLVNHVDPTHPEYWNPSFDFLKSSETQGLVTAIPS